MSFYRPQNFFLGNIFKYMKKKSAIFAENMKKVGVCRFKKVRFSQPFGVKLKISKKKTTTVTRCIFLQNYPVFIFQILSAIWMKIKNSEKLYSNWILI